MGRINWEEGREEREKEALAFHQRLSTLYREDRLAFERERRRLIDGIISQARTEEEKMNLRGLQESIDRKMRGAGSGHNRLVLMKKLFWDQFDSFREALSKV